MSKTIEQMLELLDKADKSYADANTEGPKIIYDGDSILRDQGIPVDPGTYPEISRIYRNSKDKEAVAEIFETLTDMPFDVYLEECIEKTTTTPA